jgi:peptidoglycan/xylan/chitin deacetylase (PgdA/CDA1 family)
MKFNSYMMKFNSYIRLGLVGSFLLNGLAELVAATDYQQDKISLVDDPVYTVQEFYQAVKNHDCDKAQQIRPGYSVESCYATNNVEVLKIELIEKPNNHHATVLLEVNYQKKQDEKFYGYVTLSKKGNAWIIENDSYQSKQDLVPYSELTDLSPSPNNSHQLPQSLASASGFTDVLTEYQLISNHDFGSNIILKRCWTELELQGSKADKKVIRPVPNPNRQPPLRTEPYHYLKPVEPEWRGSIRYVETDEKVVALTFDLCERNLERTGYDAEIVNYLRKERIKATFYAGGKWMRSHPEKTMQLMADPLFEIGNHTWTHGNMRVLKGQKMREQILWTQAQYKLLRDELERKNCATPSEFEKIPRVPLTFRFPYGTCSPESLQALAEYGLPAIQWNVVTADPWANQTVKGIINTVNHIRAGSIIIAHANGRGHNTAQALPLLVNKIKEQGYRFVTVTELLNLAKKVVTKETCYELKPGDNKRYDRIFGEGTE